MEYTQIHKTVTRIGGGGSKYRPQSQTHTHIWSRRQFFLSVVDIPRQMDANHEQSFMRIINPCVMDYCTRTATAQEERWQADVGGDH